MDDIRFETLLRSLFETPSRRGAMRLLAASALGGLLSSNRVEAARKKKRKGKGNKTGTPTSPPPTSPPLPTRQSVTRTFSNLGQIDIPGNAVVGSANPYPATIIVSGFTNGTITDVNVILINFNHTVPHDIDVLLAATQIAGVNAIVMSDVGGNTAAVNVTLVLDDQAAAPLPVGGPLVNGSFQPNNPVMGETFPSPAPPPTGNSALSVFNGGNPNGTWQLFVVDDSLDDNGFIADGWAIQITAEIDV